MSGTAEPAEIVESLRDSPLAPCYAKLDRADRHLEELAMKVRMFYDEHDFGFTGVHDAKRGVYTVYPCIPAEPPMEWGAIVGDFVHNLRSALDLLMWQLVLARGGKPSRRTQFPIFERRADYRLRGRLMIAGVARGDRGMIECLQPFREMRRPLAGAHPLAQLARLANADKHQEMPPSTMGWGLTKGAQQSEIERWRPNADAGSIEKTTFTRSFLDSTRLQAGIPILRFKLATTGPVPVVEVPAVWTVAVSISGIHGFSSAEWIRDGVHRVFEKLGPRIASARAGG